MPYTRRWTPTLVDLENSPRIHVKTWDGRPVKGHTYFVSAKTLVLTVQEPNIYKVTVQSGPDEETVRLTIPLPAPTSIEDRLRAYIDDILVDYTPPNSSGGSVTEDPDNPGFFIYTPPPA